MKTKKLLIMIVVVISLLAVAVLGTYAYFALKLDPMANVFTYGNVKLELYQDSEVGEGTTNKSNEYELKWGTFYENNVTVKLCDGSDPCYAFVVVVNELADVESSKIKESSSNLGIKEYVTIATQINNNGWNEYPIVDSDYINIYYRALPNAGTYAFLKEFRTADQFDYTFTDVNENNIAPEMVFTVYAIEKDDSMTPEMAWNILKSQFDELENYSIN